ncbi:MAG: hypothetical protein ABSE64_12175 [Vulcanimicrobiaceae bacterium]
MRSIFALAATALFALSISAAHAQSMESTPAPAPKKPSLAPVSFLEGSWSCWYKSSRRPSVGKYSVTYAPDMTGFWLIEKSTSPGTPWFPYPSKSVDMITYDRDSSRWIDSYTDSQGNYDLSTSKGWVGSKWVWHSLAFLPGPDILSQTDSTVTKISATKYSTYNGFVTKKGRKVSVTGGCTKS